MQSSFKYQFDFILVSGSLVLQAIVKYGKPLQHGRKYVGNMDILLKD